MNPIPKICTNFALAYIGAIAFWLAADLVLDDPGGWIAIPTLVPAIFYAAFRYEKQTGQRPQYSFVWRLSLSFAAVTIPLLMLVTLLFIAARLYLPALARVQLYPVYSPSLLGIGGGILITAFLAGALTPVFFPWGIKSARNAKARRLRKQRQRS